MKHTTSRRSPAAMARDGYDPNDPIYDAIATHRAALAKLEIESAEHERLQKLLLNRKNASPTNKRKFRTAEQRYNRASDREAEVFQKVVTLRPKSALGASVLLKHVREQIAHEGDAEIILPGDMITMLDNVREMITPDWANKLSARYV